MTLRLVFGVVALLLGVSAVGRAQPDAGRMFPVSLNVEGEYVRTTALLRLPYKAYGQPARNLSGPSLDADDQAFLRFVEAVRGNDERAFTSMLAPREPRQGGDRPDAVIAAPRTAAQTLALYRDSFGGFEDLRVEGRVAVDDGSLFIWSAATAKGRMVRGSLVRVAGAGRQVAEVTMDRPVETFIVNSLNRLSPEELAGSSRAMAAAAPTYALPLTKTGVELRFSGVRPNVRIPGGAAPAGPIATLTEKVRAAQTHSVEALMALHTPKSTAKLKQWLGTMNREAQDAWLAELARPREVALVMDAGPVLIVFSAPVQEGRRPSQDVQYDYVVRQGESYRLANVLYASFFDDLLKGTTAVAQFLEQGARR